VRALVLVALGFFAGCDRGPFDQPLPLGGRSYSTAQLNRGFHLYQKGCRACHGDRGDGHGTSAAGLWPPPRDLTQGIYKFGRVPAPDLPPDAELTRILRNGLTGTAMLPWLVADDDLDPLLGYIKSLSPRWRTERVGVAPKGGADPYANASTAERRSVLARGEALYHGKALCSTCHPAYVTRQRLFEITSKIGMPITAYTPQMYGSRIKDSEYCWRWHGTGDDRVCDEPVHTIPPDFTRDLLRAVRPTERVRDLFLTLAGGINGAGMPPWKGVLPDEDLWTLSYYVASLVELRGTEAAETLRQILQARSNIEWVAP
jgi:mono/diheme cytochrome c family protein